MNLAQGGQLKDIVLEIMCSLLQGSYGQIRRGCVTKRYPGHSIILNGEITLFHPHESMKVPIIWVQVNSAVHLTDVRADSN